MEYLRRPVQVLIVTENENFWSLLLQLLAGESSLRVVSWTGLWSLIAFRTNNWMRQKVSELIKKEQVTFTQWRDDIYSDLTNAVFREMKLLVHRQFTSKDNVNITKLGDEVFAALKEEAMNRFTDLFEKEKETFNKWRKETFNDLQDNLTTMLTRLFGKEMETLNERTKNETDERTKSQKVEMVEVATCISNLEKKVDKLSKIQEDMEAELTRKQQKIELLEKNVMDLEKSIQKEKEQVIEGNKHMAEQEMTSLIQFQSRLEEFKRTEMIDELKRYQEEMSVALKEQQKRLRLAEQEINKFTESIKNEQEMVKQRKDYVLNYLKSTEEEVKRKKEEFLVDLQGGQEDQSKKQQDDTLT